VACGHERLDAGRGLTYIIAMECRRR